MIVTVEPDAVAPRIRIESTFPQLWRVTPDGAYTVVRGVPDAGVLYDYECPQETPVSYSSMSSRVLPLPAGHEESTPVELPEMGLWLVHPGAPDLSRRVTLSSHDGWVTPSASSTVDIPGGDTFAVTFRRGSDAGSLLVKLWNRTDVDDFRALVGDGSVLFLSAPHDLGIGSGFVCLGDVSWTRVGQRTDSQHRFASFSFRFVRRPAVLASTAATIDALTGTIDSLTGTIDSLGD